MKRLYTVWFKTLASTVALTASAGTHAISISDVPLFVTTAATPNVMVLFDNSGSMNNVIWAPAFDPGVNYPDWSPSIDHDCNTSTPLREAWTAGDGNLLRSYLVSSNVRGTCQDSTDTGTTCPSGTVRGRNDAGATKCLTLPDPVNSNATRYTGNYLNYLFNTYPDGTNLTQGQIPTSFRLQVAKNVAANLVNNNSNLRFGIASFNPPSSSDGGPGGTINAVCGSNNSTLLSAISSRSANSNTPLAETFYEITRYFRGLGSFFNSNTAYTSPIQYRCQKNFVIVVTDGFPTWDTQFPADDPADVADTSRSLPNWDGLAPATQASTYPIFPQYSDGYAPDAPAAQGEGRTLYLDDLAKFGNDIDLITTGNDNAGVSFNDPQYRQQNLVTYTVGFTVANQMLSDAAQYGDGRYYTAANEAQLNDALQSAISDVVARTSSSASVATNSTRLSADTFIYQARFSSADWSGQLLAFPIDSTGAVGPQRWDAAALIPAPASRRIFTYDPTQVAGSRGRNFLWSELNTGQQSALNINAAGTADGNGPQRVDYLRGVRSNEAPGGLGFRTRSGVLGDLVNSDPYFVGKQDYGFDKLPGAEGTGYTAFRASDAYQSRPAMLYVGGNDGMLHGFDAANGVERLAYVPNAVMSKLSALTGATYNQSHKYFVDGSPRAVDAYLGEVWKTILLGALGAGGKGIFALDVTAPATFGASDVLWEFTDANNANLGISIPQPSIARMANGSWAAIVANGYNSANHQAVLFILDLATGAVLAELNTNAGSSTAQNGLSNPIPVDVDGDRITDYIYAGDLLGNLWKFDVTASNPNNWKVAFGNTANPAPLFVACGNPGTTSDCNDTRQPITARPEVGINPKGGFNVYFGTGRYFAVGDNSVSSPAPVMTFYGIQDRNAKGESSPQANGGRSTLLQQTVLGTATVSSEQVRVTSDNAPSDSHQGWYLDLPEAGERQISTPILRGGRIIFSTLTPNASDPCGFGGTSWLMELDALTGSRLSHSPFDLNRDRQFNRDDFATITVGGNTITVPVSGRQSKEGIIKTPGVITAGEIEFKYASGTSGGIDTTVEKGDSASGRQSWRQIQ